MYAVTLADFAFELLYLDEGADEGFKNPEVPYMFDTESYQRLS